MAAETRRLVGLVVGLVLDALGVAGGAGLVMVWLICELEALR